MANGLVRERIAFVQRDDLGLARQVVTIGLDLRADGSIGAGDILAGTVDQMQQDPAPLDMAEEAIAEACPFVCPGDQARYVGQNEPGVGDLDDPEVGIQGREGIVGDLRLGMADPGEKGRLAGIRQPDQAGIGDQLEAQPEREGFSGFARIGPPWRPVG